MRLQRESALFCYLFLAPLNAAIDELFDFATGRAKEMAMMTAFVQLEHGSA